MAEPASLRVYLHIGAPKTGTTYLQRRLFRNRAQLADDGVLYPYTDFGQSFRSMHDFCGTGWGGKQPEHFQGQWETVASRVRSWPGSTAIISNELFGNASPERISLGLARLGDAETHIVFTARDFARQLVSDWQEHVKHKHTVSLEKFVDDLMTRGINAPKPFGEMFWGLHDAARVLGRWTPFVPPERIHLVTLPQPGGPPDALWRRFCATTQLNPDRYRDLRNLANRSMGVAETEFVRRLNQRVRKVPARDYDPVVRRLLAERVLGNRSGRLTLPPEYLDWAIERSTQLVGDLRPAGYDVVGDLDDLLPRRADHAEHIAPSQLSAQDMSPVAMRATAGLLRYSARQKRHVRELRSMLEDLPAATSSVPDQPDATRPLSSRIRDRSRWLRNALKN
ncbi:MAG: hypothetical protein ACRDO2_09620 [Nocardioidaceae bacterium]